MTAPVARVERSEARGCRYVMSLDCAEPVIGRRFRPLAGHGVFLLNLARLIVIGFALNPCNIPSNLDQTRPI
jgi:hypothetical protein